MNTDTQCPIPGYARWAVEESAALADERSPFQGHVTDGDPRLVLITGPNASGKSLAFRLIAQMAGSDGLWPVTISIRERTGSGEPPGSMRRAMMFGNESERSTGSVSARIVGTAFDQMEQRPAILGLDEPEIGLSPGYAAALGEYIGIRTRGVHANCRGVMVVTHDRRLAEGVALGLGAEPTFVSMEGDAISFGEWLTRPEVRSVDDLLALPQLGLERFRAVADLLRSGETEK